MSIQGSLDTFDLSNLLQMIKYERKSGKLTISSKDNDVQLLMQEGDIVFATESRKTNRIGQLLVNNGVISSKILDEALVLSRKKKQGIGKTLVEQGRITVGELNAFLLKQAENSIYNVFLWESGQFIYKDEDLDLKKIVGSAFNTMNILLEASRRIDELQVLKKSIPDENAVPKICKYGKDVRDIELNTDELLVLSLVDGISTVRRIINEIGWDDFTGYSIFHSLVSAGEIEIVQPLSPRRLAQKAVNQLKGVDSRQLRQTLDSLNLTRSSVVRMALTRLFRDASSHDQLLESAVNEAGKITDPKEKANLKQLLESTPTPYLKNLLELLWQATETDILNN
jgi:hypothetical protein